MLEGHALPAISFSGFQKAISHMRCGQTQVCHRADRKQIPVAFLEGVKPFFQFLKCCVKLPFSLTFRVICSCRSFFSAFTAVNGSEDKGGEGLLNTGFWEPEKYSTLCMNVTWGRWTGSGSGPPMTLRQLGRPSASTACPPFAPWI